MHSCSGCTPARVDLGAVFAKKTIVILSLWLGVGGGELENMKPRAVVSPGQLAETQSTKLSTNSRISVRLERELCAGNVGWPALPERN